jgi:hypothetical protein
MTHYVFFTALDYGVRIKLPMWSYEGIAEYCAKPGEKLLFSLDAIDSMRIQCDFSAPHFPYVYQNYSGGESIYRYMETAYSKKGVSDFLHTLYSEGVTPSLQRNFRIDLKTFEQNWKKNLSQFAPPSTGR